MHLEKNNTLVIASHNLGKISEINHLLKEFSFHLLNSKELGLTEPEETGSTFSENALIKARATALASGHAALADDSGLCVFALDGEPGIYSARWAGPSKDFLTGITTIEKKLTAKNTGDYSAKFVCALALCFPNGEEIVVEGEVFGHLIFPPRGTLGFGYDPIFIPNGMAKTYGEISPQLKEEINHRAIAFKKLKDFFSS